MAELVDAKDSQNDKVPLNAPRTFKFDKKHTNILLTIKKNIFMDNEKLCKCNELSREIRILNDQLRIATNGTKIKSTIDFYNQSAQKYEELNTKFVDFESIKAIAIQRIENELKSKTEEFENM